MPIPGRAWMSRPIHFRTSPWNSHSFAISCPCQESLESRSELGYAEARSSGLVTAGIGYPHPCPLQRQVGRNCRRQRIVVAKKVVHDVACVPEANLKVHSPFEIRLWDAGDIVD